MENSKIVMTAPSTFTLHRYASHGTNEVNKAAASFLQRSGNRVTELQSSFAVVLKGVVRYPKSTALQRKAKSNPPHNTGRKAKCRTPAISCLLAKDQSFCVKSFK